MSARPTVAEALREIGLTVERAERDAMLLDGRDFDQARYDEAHRLVALLRERLTCPQCGTPFAAREETT